MKSAGSMVLLVIVIFLFLSCELFYKDTTSYGDVYVVSVGLDYKNNPISNINVLNGTLNDAYEQQKAWKLVAEQANRTFHGYLLTQEGPSRTQPTFEDPSYPSWTNIQATLNSIKNAASENDLIIFTYSGHGLDKKGDLILAHTETTGTPDIQDILLAPEVLLEKMASLPGRKLVIIDSCYSGLFVQEGESSLSTHYYKRIDQWFAKYFDDMKYAPPTMMVLTAAAAHDSYETNAEHSHGIFTKTLLNGLGWTHPHTPDHTAITVEAMNNNRLTVDSLYSYIKKNQGIRTSWSLFLNSNFQHPTTTGGPLDMVLFQF